MSNRLDIETYLRTAFDPAQALRQPLWPPAVERITVFPVGRNVAYRPAVPADQAPHSNLYLPAQTLPLGSWALRTPEMAVWDAIAAQALRSDPVFLPSLRQLQDADGWKQLRSSGTATSFLSALAVRVTTLLAGCRETVAVAAEHRVAFVDTGTPALPTSSVLNPAPTWWMLGAGGIAPGRDTAVIGAVAVQDLETWKVGGGAWRGDFTGTELAVGIGVGEADPPHGFLVTTASGSASPPVLTRIGTLYR